MSGLLKFMTVAGLAAVVAWAGYDFLSRPDVQARLHQMRQQGGSATAPIDAMGNLGQSIQSADDRAAQQIRCAGRSDC